MGQPLMKKAFRYQILVDWGDEDRAFIARVPAVSGCVAHGPTAEKAKRAAEVAAGLMLDIMQEDERTPPPAEAVADCSAEVDAGPVKP